MKTVDEKAKDIVKVYLRRPDWVDIGYDDCFVCGTPISEVNYEKRTKAIVDAIAQALTLHAKEKDEEIDRLTKAHTDLVFNSYDREAVDVSRAKSKEVMEGLVKALEEIVSHYWVKTSSDNGKWINEFVDIAEKALTKYKEHIGYKI